MPRWRNTTMGEILRLHTSLKRCACRTKTPREAANLLILKDHKNE